LSNFLRNGIAARAFIRLFLLGLFYGPATADWQLGCPRVFGGAPESQITLSDRPEDIRVAAKNRLVDRSAVIEFHLTDEGRTSLGIFERTSGALIRTLLSGERLETGTHRFPWDGRNNRAELVPAGEYEWRLLNSPGLIARYVTTIGINPPGGEDPEPKKSWVGDHLGAGIVDVDSSGVYVGSPLTEGGRMILKADSAMSRVEWSRPQFYQSGRLNRIAASGVHVFLVHPNGKLRRLNRDTGRVETEWQVDLDGSAPVDLDARHANLVVTYPDQGVVRWLSTKDGTLLASQELPGATAVAVLDSTEKGRAFVSSANRIYELRPDQTPRQLAMLDGVVTAVDFDELRGELWLAVDGCQVLRLDAAFRIAQTYGDTRRPLGPYDPSCFSGIYDIAADLRGGFFIGEPADPPRRLAHFSRDGTLLNEWYGCMSFYISGAFDPADLSRLIGIAPEGFVNVYTIDYESGEWCLDACYETGLLGDSLFPFTGSYRAVRRNGQLYLYHRAIPAVLRLDSALRKAIPVAIAGRVINRGRTFHQFAGTGRDGYPAPWVAAAEHHGYRDLKTAPELYSWADVDGDGEFDPKEFRFYPGISRNVSFHNPGDFTPGGDYIVPALTNAEHALVRVPVTRWEGPSRAAPRWDWKEARCVGKVTVDPFGWGSPRGLSIAQDGFISVAYQAGIMIREHGQYEGGGWPEAGLKGSRLLGFNRRFQPTFAVGRQSKDPAEANSGVLYYPMQTAAGPHGSVVVNDQTKQPAQVWTRDGLYVGSFFDGRAADGRDNGFYRVHGDDNQGCTVVSTPAGTTYWLMPYQGHNRLYEITGWTSWKRQSGRVALPADVAEARPQGVGLAARYYRDEELVYETTEIPIYHEPFGGERHAGNVTAPYTVTWTGFLLAPLTDRYQFHSLLGDREQVAVWIDGHLVHAAGTPKTICEKINLRAGQRHLIHIEYINPSERAELKLLWSSRVLDPAQLPAKRLYPASSPR
jgi:hypothetical protein